MGGAEPCAVTLSRRCSAPPEAVYDVLTELRTHLVWGGTRQRGSFRLVSLDAAEGTAAVGSVFVTTGTIPGTRRRWEDRSTVCSATRPSVFEFSTEAVVRRGRTTLEAAYVHRYDIAAAQDGSQVRYTMRQTRIVHPFLRLRLPVIRQMTWGIGIPLLAGRGFRNLLAEAEARSAQPAGAAPALRRTSGERAASTLAPRAGGRASVDEQGGA